jgi:hypothetical protein
LRHFGRFLPTPPVVSPLKINARLLPYFHGMEEVVGSNPTRSTNLISTQRVTRIFVLVLEFKK